MKPPQLYPDLSVLRISRNGKTVEEVVVLYKNGAQYHICNVKAKQTYHATEPTITKYIQQARLLENPLNEALK